MKEPTLQDLECLICWPRGTVGYFCELQIVSNLLNMAKVHGFGRVSQLAQQMEDVWRNEGTARIKFEAAKKEHLQFMALKETLPPYENLDNVVQSVVVSKAPEAKEKK